MIDTRLFRKAMHDIADKKGEFVLFALLLRPDALGAWDLLVSAPWLKRTLSANREFVQLLIQSFGEKPLLLLARVVVLNDDDPSAKFILENIPVEDGEIHMPSTDLLGMQIEKGIIFRAMKPKPPSRRVSKPRLQPTKSR